MDRTWAVRAVGGDSRVSESEHLGQNSIIFGDAEPGQSQAGEGESHGTCERSRPHVDGCVGSPWRRGEFRALLHIWGWPVFRRHFKTRD